MVNSVKEPRQVLNTVKEPRQVVNSVKEPRQVVNSVKEPRQVVKEVFYGQEPPSGESTTTECGFNYQLLAVIY